MGDAKHGELTLKVGIHHYVNVAWIRRKPSCAHGTLFAVG